VLLDSAPWYREQEIKNLGYRFIPAIEHGKVRYYMDNGRMTGFVTWAFLTREEADTGVYGPSVFGRKDGPLLWVMDMVARDSVSFIIRDLREYLSNETKHEVAYFRRGDRIGSVARLRSR
jgi:hemolysin-activating ACP:hemolysin acyltransferase